MRTVNNITFGRPLKISTEAFGFYVKITQFRRSNSMQPKAHKIQSSFSANARKGDVDGGAGSEREVIGLSKSAFI